MTHSKYRKMAVMALFTAIALGIHFLELQLPAPIPVPGVKLGLANIVTLVAICLLGKKEAGVILLMRIFLGALFSSSPSTLLFSAAGGLAAYGAMCLLTRIVPEDLLYVTSAVGGVCHNAAQLAMCAFVVKTPGVLAYAPVLAASGILTGLFTGITGKYLVKALKNRL